MSASPCKEGKDCLSVDARSGASCMPMGLRHGHLLQCRIPRPQVSASGAAAVACMQLECNGQGHFCAIFAPTCANSAAANHCRSKERQGAPCSSKQQRRGTQSFSAKVGRDGAAASEVERVERHAGTPLECRQVGYGRWCRSLRAWLRKARTYMSRGEAAVMPLMRHLWLAVAAWVTGYATPSTTRRRARNRGSSPLSCSNI